MVLEIHHKEGFTMKVGDFRGTWGESSGMVIKRSKRRLRDQFVEGNLKCMQVTSGEMGFKMGDK